jgi:hypothetical protein
MANVLRRRQITAKRGAGTGASAPAAIWSAACQALFCMMLGVKSEFIPLSQPTCDDPLSRHHRGGKIYARLTAITASTRDSQMDGLDMTSRHTTQQPFL